MIRIINFSDRKLSEMFYQIKLDDEKRILVYFTQTEIAILKIAFGTITPTGTIFKYNINEFLDFFCLRVKQIGINGWLFQAVVDYILPCKNINEVAVKLKAVIEGYSHTNLKTEIKKKLQKQVL